MTKRARSVLVICRHFGGFGGEENYIMCLVDALKDRETVVFATKSISRFGLLPQPRANLRVEQYTTMGFLAHLARNRKRTALLLSFSADYFPKERLVYKALDACTFPKIVIPAGNDVSRVIAHYDHIGWEANNAAAYGFAHHPKNLLLYPPGLHTANFPSDFPALAPASPFYLTVFNGYHGGMKGVDVVYEVARRSLYPIVWCTSRRPLPDGIPGKLYPVFASRDLLSALMRQCRAYVCFSATEGFGWSIFEAMTHERPIVSRPVGVAGDFAETIYGFQGSVDLIELLNCFAFPASVQYSLERFSPALYISRLDSVIDSRLPI